MSDGESKQVSLPGVDPKTGSYQCSHGRTHIIPSETVRVLKMFTGFVGVCGCEGYNLEKADEKPYNLSENTVLFPTSELDNALWLQLEELSDGWFHNPDSGDSFGDPTYRERRESYKEEITA